MPLDFSKRAEKPKAKKRSVADDVYGAVTTFNRNFLPFVDEAADAVQAGVNLAKGRAKGLGEAWDQARAQSGGAAESFAAERPNAAALTRGTAWAGQAAVPTGPATGMFAAGSRAGNMARGATAALGTGAVYAGASDGSAAERLDKASRAAMDPLTAIMGAGAGALSPAAPKPKTKGQQYGDTLKAIGVSTTPAQRAGRSAKGLEDLGRRFPITGQAMAGYQDRQLSQLNRGVGLKALEPIGADLPADIPAGFEMVRHIDDQLGGVYDQAARLAPRVAVDETLADDLARISARQVDLADSEAAQFGRIVEDRLARLNGPEASGEMVKKIHSELGGLQAEAAKQGKDTMASMLGETRRAVMGLVERATPEAGALVSRADEGWHIYSIMNDAAAKASARGGVFLPGQLNTEVGAAAKRMGSNMRGKGLGPLQDIATAATQTIPDTYGNPGTANAGLLAGGGWGALTAPVETATAAAGLTAVATPYFLAGRKVLERLPDNASGPELMSAAAELRRLSAQDPAVAEMYRQVVARLTTSAGAAGGLQAAERASTR